MKKTRKKEDGQSVDSLGARPTGPIRRRVTTAKDLIKTIRDAQKLKRVVVVKKPRV